MRNLLIHLFCLIAIVQLSEAKILQDSLTQWFDKVDSIPKESESLSDYFNEISGNYLLHEHRSTYLGFFDYVESQEKLLNNSIFYNHYYLFKARVFRLSQEFSDAFSALNRISDDIGSFTKRDSINYLIMYHITTMEIGLFQESIEYAERIDEIGDIPSTRGNSEYAPDIYWLIGVDYSYSMMGDYKNAIRVAKKTLSEFKIRYPKDYFFLLNRHNNIGVYYNRDKEPDSALVYFNKALQYLKKEDFDAPMPKTTYQALVEGNMAQSYILKRMYDNAIPLLEEDLRRSKDYLPQNIFINAILLAECYVAKKNTDNAEAYLKVYDSLAKKIPPNINKDYIETLYETRANLELLKGSPENAITFLKKKLAFKDSLKLRNDASESLALQAAFEFDNKEKELLQAKLEASQMKANLERRNFIIALGILIILLLIILAFWSYRSKNKQEKLAISLKSSNNIVEENRKTIERALKEKEVLLKEIHHRVKNNLQVVSSLLSLQGNTITNEIAKEALKNGQLRVRSMALVHQRLYESESYKDINFKDYMEQLVPNLIASYSLDKLITYEVASNENIDIDVAVPLGLIVNEMVTNSIKYCKHECLIKISLTSGSSYILEVSDNGGGFDYKKVRANNTLGLKLVDILVKQLEGTIHFERQEPESSVYTITFPKAMNIAS